MSKVAMTRERAELISGLQTDILRLEGFKSANNTTLDLGLGSITSAFPNGTFPLGCMHEFIAAHAEDDAPTCAFIGGLLAALMGNHGATLWISSSRKIFPPALKSIGLHPDHLIFIDLQNEKDVIWALDEALKCSALTAVVCEVKGISFTASRRLQLAVEESKVTGFIIRNFQHLTTSASVSRWRITSLPSEQVDDLPGVGFPRWRVELLRVRNGKPSGWDVTWTRGRFSIAPPQVSSFPSPAFKEMPAISYQPKAG